MDSNVKVFASYTYNVLTGSQIGSAGNRYFTGVLINKGSSIGLNTDGSTATQQMTGGNLSVSGIGATTALTQGPNITLSGVTCLLNSASTIC